MYRYFSLVFAVFCVCLFGCSGEERPEGMPQLFSCSMTIQQDGQPLADASITLVPLDDSNRWGSGGTTDANGVLRPMTYGKFPGVPEGKYKILVQKTITENELPPLPMDATEADQKAYAQQVKANPPQQFDLVDVKFKKADTTPLEITVEKGGSNSFPLDVGAAVKVPIKMLL